MRAALIVCALVLGCSGAKDELSQSAGDCGARPMIEGVCVGVPETPVCSSEVCVDGVTCSRIWAARDEATLAATRASSGECITLAPGSYGDLRLAGGVHVLGRGASAVTVRSLGFTGLGDSKVRGLGVVGGNVVSTDVNLELDQVAVRGAPAAAVQVDNASLTITQTTVEQGGAQGISVRCSEACAAGTRPKLVARRTWVHDQKLVGVLGSSIDADLRDVVIERITASSFMFGRGLEVNGRSTLQAPYLRIEHCADIGLAMFTSVGTLGPGLALRDVVRGVALQAVPEGGVLVDGFEIRDVFAVALNIDGASRAVVLRNGSAFGTKLMSIPVDIGGIDKIGDALEWGAGSEVNVEASVRLSSSARRPAVIAPSARGTFAARLLDDDDALGVFVLDPGGPASHPALSFAPGIKVEYGDRVPVATGPSTVKP